MASPVAPSDTEESVTTPPALSRAIGVITAASIGLLTVFFVMTGLARVIGDDYKIFWRMKDLDLPHAIWHHLHAENGRYGQASLVAVGYHLFGERSAMIMTAACGLLLIAACCYAAWEFCDLTPGMRLRGLAMIGLTAPCLAIFTAISLPDSFLWLTSATVYVPGLALAVASAAAIHRLLRPDHRRRWWQIAASLALVFATQGFCEPIDLLVIAAVGLVLVVKMIRRRWRDAGYLGAVAVAAIAGFATIYFAPAQTRRIENGSDQSIGEALGNVGSTMSTIWRLWPPGSLALCIAVGLALAPLLAWTKIRTAIWTACFGAVALVVPNAVSLFTSFYAVGGAPSRLYLIGTAFMAWGIAALTAAAAWALLRLVPKPYQSLCRATAAVAGLLIFVVGIGLQTPIIGRVIVAESLRTSMVTERDRLVRESKADGADVVPILPAPLLFDPVAWTLDFGYQDEQLTTWFPKTYRYYQGLPDDDLSSRISLVQPLGYCTEVAGVPSGAISCQDLATRFIDEAEGADDVAN